MKLERKSSSHPSQGLIFSAHQGGEAVQATESKWRESENLLVRLSQTYHRNREDRSAFRVRVLNITVNDAKEATLQHWNGGRWETITPDNHHEIVGILKSLKECLTDTSLEVNDLHPLIELDDETPLLGRASPDQELRDEIGRLRLGQRNILEELHNLQHELKGVRLQESQKAQQAEDLIRQIKDNDLGIRELDDQLERLAQKNEKQVEQYRQVTEGRDESVRENEALKQHLEETLQSLEELRQSNRDMMDRINRLEQDAKRLNQELQGAQLEVRRKDQQMQDLNERLQGRQQDIQRLQDDLGRLRNEQVEKIRRVSGKRDEAVQECDDVRRQLREMKLSLEKAQQRERDSVDEAQLFRDQLGQQTSRAEKLQGRVQEVIEREQKTVEQLRRVQEENIELRRELGQRTENAKRLQREKEQLELELEALKQVGLRRDEVVERSQELQGALEELKQSQLGNLEKIQRLQNELDEERNGALQLEQTNDQLSRQVRVQSEELEGLRELNGKRDEQDRDYQRQIEQGILKLQASEDKVEQIQKRQCEREQIYQAILEKSAKVIAGLTQEYKRRIEELTQGYERELREKSEQLDDLQQQKKGMEKTISEMVNLVEEYRQRVDQLEEAARKDASLLIDDSRERIRQSTEKLVEASRTVPSGNNVNLTPKTKPVVNTQAAQSKAIPIADDDLKEYENLRNKNDHQLRRMIQELVKMVRFQRGRIQGLDNEVRAKMEIAIRRYPSLKDTFQYYGN